MTESSADGYASIISRNLLIQEPKYSETILTDDALAGQAPASIKANGPVISQDIDPQMAALADAFKKRLDAFAGKPNGCPREWANQDHQGRIPRF